MGKRAVFLEKSWVDFAGAVGVYHYAVKVDNDWYEIGAEGGSSSGGSSSSSSSSSNGAAKRNVINGSHNGRPNRNREIRFTASLVCAGATYKTDREILDFNIKWIQKNPNYDALFENCQKYALDLIQYLVGGSFKMEIPLSSLNAWADGPGSHAISKKGYNQARATTGKAGAQWTNFAAEAEGPSAGAEAYAEEGYIGAEASLGRAEVQALGVGARLEPNVNTGIGVTGGQFKVKAVGFGITVGKGFGIHTPLGSIGFGKF